MLTLLASFAQADNQSRRMNIKWGMQKKVHDGSSVLFKKKCYGFSVDDNGELVINEREARVVRWIFQRYLNGNSLLSIQRQLEEAGVQSPSGKKEMGLQIHRWHPSEREVLRSSLHLQNIYVRCCDTEENHKRW